MKKIKGIKNKNFLRYKKQIKKIIKKEKERREDLYDIDEISTVMMHIRFVDGRDYIVYKNKYVFDWLSPVCKYL